MEKMGENTTCCSVSYRTATIIIGVLHSIASFISTILFAIYANNTSELRDIVPEALPEQERLKIIASVFAGYCAIYFIFSIFIIFGATGRQPRLLLPWLSMKPIGIGLYLVGTLILIVLHIMYGQIQFGLGHLFFGSLVLAMAIWQYRIVYRHYKELVNLNF